MQGAETESRIVTMVGGITVAAAVRFDDAVLLQSAQDLGLDLNVRGENDLLPLYRACKVTPGSPVQAHGIVFECNAHAWNPDKAAIRLP